MKFLHPPTCRIAPDDPPHFSPPLAGQRGQQQPRQRLFDPRRRIHLAHFHNIDWEIRLLSAWPPRPLQPHSRNTPDGHNRGAGGLAPTRAYFHCHLAQNRSLAHLTFQISRPIGLHPIPIPSNDEIYPAALAPLPRFVKIRLPIRQIDPAAPVGRRTHPLQHGRPALRLPRASSSRTVVGARNSTDSSSGNGAARTAVGVQLSGGAEFILSSAFPTISRPRDVSPRLRAEPRQNRSPLPCSPASSRPATGAAARDGP
jgi:hypothetical protein